MKIWKNKKGQKIFAGVMIFIMLVIAVIQLIPVVRDQVTDARSDSYLDCENSTISTGTKSTCVVTDFTLFYFVGMAIAAAGGVFFLKKAAQ